MLENLSFYLGLIIVIVLLIMLAKKINVAYPILLVLAGLLISFIPGIPTIHIEPELIFFIFLPPLLYEAAWATSWKELWRWRRIVLSFAFLVVFLTSLAVAFVANHFIPGFSLALGFLLGGIVSPPDAVSAGAILKFVKVPKRFSSILEGESLLNDASSLIVFRFAMIAVATGLFVWHEAALSFVWMCIGGVGIGVLIGLIFIQMHKYLPTDTNMDVILSLIAPFIMYLAAEEVHASGVLAVVSGGLFLSVRNQIFLTSSSRLQGLQVWENLSFIMNGLVFMMIGLDLPQIVAGLDVPLSEAILYGVLITLVLVVIRIIAAYSAVITTLIMRNFITVADAQNPGWQGPLMIGWTGMRGVVSLAAALSIPVALQDGTPFPHRNLILFITFVVILLTLVVQGLTLPVLLNKITIEDRDFTRPEKEIDNELHNELAQIAADKIRNAYHHKLLKFPALEEQLQQYERRANSTEIILNFDEFKDIYHDILETQRQWLIAKNREELLLNEDLVKKHLRRLDLEEERIGYLN